MTGVLHGLLGIKARKKGPDGYTFRSHDRDTFIYEVGDRRGLIVGDRLLGPPDFVVYASDSLQHWMPPHEQELLDPEQRAVILARFGEWMARRGSSIEIKP